VEGALLPFSNRVVGNRLPGLLPFAARICTGFFAPPDVPDAFLFRPTHFLSEESWPGSVRG
jgi:hypothetical protein